MTAVPPRPLTPEILDRVLALSDEAGAAFGAELQPGLTDAQIDALADRFSLAVPTELRTLWRWGVVPTSATNITAWLVRPEFELLPPELALQETIKRRQDDYKGFAPSWVAVCIEQSPYYLAIDAARETNGIAPVVYRSEPIWAAAPSFGELFLYWIHQIETGGTTFQNGRWRAHTDEPGWIRTKHNHGQYDY